MGLNMETIKTLREKSGAGMVDCKKALEEANGDIDMAVEVLRKRGIAKAAKRTDRETSEGVIKLSTNDEGTEGYILEINAETDFVVRNSKFQDFADKVIDIAKTSRPQNLEELLNLNMDKGTVKDALDSLSGIIGEKMTIKRFDALSIDGTVGAYSHLGGQKGVLVALNKKGEKDLAYDIAMQVAAANPRYIDRSEIPAEEIAKEKEIYNEQLAKEGKPANIVEKIIEGKISKFFEEVCLVDQDFIKDDSKKIRDILGDAKIIKFIRYSL